MKINKIYLKKLITEELNRIKFNDLLESRKKQITSLNEILSKIPNNIDTIPKKTLDKEILRIAIIAELDAVSLYEQLANNAQDKNIKKVLLDIAKEEKTHVGEFETLLKQIDVEYKQELKNGEKEVNELL